MERSEIRDRLPRISLRSMRATGLPASGEGNLFRGLRVSDVTPAIAAHAHIGLLGMTEEAFEHAQARAVFADHGARVVGQYLLERAGLEELADPQPAGVARRLLGRQRVVGADHLVAVGDIG